MIGHAAAIGGVAVELDAVLVGTPLGVQWNGFAIDCGQIFNILTIAIGNSAAVGLGVPARKGVAGLGIAVARQTGRRVIGHGLIGHAAAVGGVPVELDAVLVGTPLGIQLDYFAIDCGQIFNLLTIAIGGSAAVALGIPARKGVAGLGIAVARQTGRLVIGHGLIGHDAAIGGVPVEFDVIVICTPLGI